MPSKENTMENYDKMCKYLNKFVQPLQFSIIVEYVNKIKHFSQDHVAQKYQSQFSCKTPQQYFEGFIQPLFMNLADMVISLDVAKSADWKSYNSALAQAEQIFSGKTEEDELQQ